jgi:hypothetical protein
MAGLLDFAKSPAGQGLLAAGFAGLAGANRNTPINNIGRAGLAGLTGYSAAGAIDEQRQKREQAEKIKAAIPGLYGTDGVFDHRAFVGLGGSPTEAKAYAELANAGQAKVARTMQVPGADGLPMTIQLDDYGNQKGDGIATYQKPDMINVGDSLIAANPRVGDAFTVNMGPGDQQRLNQGQQRIDNGTQANDIARENNLLLNGLRLDEKQLQVDKLESEKAAGLRALEAQRAAAANQVAVVDMAIDHPGRETVTGMSGVLDPRNYLRGNDAADFGSVLDQIGGSAFLQAFESLKGGGQITEVEGAKATAAMARLNTAQRDDTFKASLEELRWVMVNGQRRLDGLPPLPDPTLDAPAAGSDYPSGWTPEKVRRFEELKARQSQGAAQ